MSGKPYDKMPDFIEAVYNLFQSVNRVSLETKDKRFNTISLLIYSYIKKIADDNNVSLTEFVEPKVINLIPIFEYISHNNIELYDFENIKLTDVDTTKREDLEKFILTHIYYITQKCL
jgi:hypothetical protein